MLSIRSLSCLLVVFAIFSVEAMQTWKGAGVSPFAFNPKDGKVYLLIGWDSARRGWNNFGGDRDRSDTSVEMNAAREGAEEMFLILDNEDEFKRLLPGSKEKVKQSKTYRSLFNNLKNEYKQGYTWLVEIPFEPKLPKKFNTRSRTDYSQRGRIPHDWREFSEIAWVSIDDIFDAYEGTDRDRIVKQLLGKNVDRGKEGKGGFGKFLSVVAPKLRAIRDEFSTPAPQPAPTPMPTPTLEPSPIPAPIIDVLQQTLDALRQALDDLKVQLQTT